MEGVFSSRYRILGAIIACYALPFLLLGMAGNIYIPTSAHWPLMGISLLIAAIGSLTLFVVISNWERSLLAEDEEAEAESDEAEWIDPAVVRDLEERYRETSDQLKQQLVQNEMANHELARCKGDILEITKDKERIHRELEQTHRDFEQFRISTEEKLEQNHIFLREYQQTINEQRSAAEAKQQHNELLDNKVRDLTYEIKTLLQLAEKGQSNKPQTVVPLSLGGQMIAETAVRYRTPDDSSVENHSREPAIQPPQNALSQLRHCIDIAQKISCPGYQMQRPSRGRDLPPSSNALDTRRLFDSLRTEATSALWVYSQQDHKLLFANQVIKPLLGWTPEKFMQNFSEIIEESQHKWNEAVSQLAYKNDCQTLLSLKSKTGQMVPLKCYLGMIPTGIFKGQIIGIAQPEG